MAAVLRDRHLRHDPACPHWPDRDRLVRSGGHGPALAGAVGMALAERRLAGEFNRDGFEPVDHLSYAFEGGDGLAGDAAQAACAFAGTQRLSRLIVLHEDRGGPVDDAAARFRACGWHVIGNVDGHDPAAVDAAIADAARWARQGRDGVFAPTLVTCRTASGGRERPSEVPAALRDAPANGARQRQDWQDRFEAWREARPDAAAGFERRIAGRLPGELDDAIDGVVAAFSAPGEGLATAQASRIVLDAIGPGLPELVGGSITLAGPEPAGAARTVVLHEPADGAGDGRRAASGRESGIAAILNGLALHGGLLPCGESAAVPADDLHDAVRVAALLRLRIVHVLVDGTIGAGEAGRPAREPDEHAARLRLVPGLDAWCPADAVETALAWQCALERDDGPSALLLTSQVVPRLSRSEAQVDAIRRGGYVLREAAAARAVLVATGAEVALALAARHQLAERDIEVRVVSMPSTRVFDRQDVTYRAYVLSENLPRVAVGTSVAGGWSRQRRGVAGGIGGGPASAAALYEHFELAVAGVVEATLAAIAPARRGEGGRN